jgi:hypothetical protein
MLFRTRAIALVLTCMAGAPACRTTDDGTVNFDALKDTVGVNDLGGGDLGPGQDGFVLPDGALPDGLVLPDGVLPDGVLPDGVLPDGVLPDVVAPSGSIKALQLASEAVACDPDGFTNVLPAGTVKNAIVTSPKYDAFTSTTGGTSLDGYYIADQDGGQWSGINLVIPRTEGTNLQPGDVVDVTGELTDRFCNSQLRMSTLQVVGTLEAPAPVDVTPPANWEPYEGMLVRVSGVKVTESLSGGRYTLEGGLVVDHEFDFFLSMKVGKTYDVVGQINYVFSQYRIQPRSADDIVEVTVVGPDADGGPIGDSADAGGDGGDSVVPGTTAISAIQGSSLSLDCAAAGGDFQNGDSDLTVIGVITTPSWSAAATLVAYGLSDGTGDPLSGIVLTLPKATDPKFAVGDTVQAKGGHLEFFCQSQFDADTAATSGVGMPLPTPPVLAKLGPDFESWEGVVVELSDVTVAKSSDFSKFGEFTVGEGLIVDSVIMGDKAIAQPTVGQKWASVRGIVRWSFGKWHLSPRSADDFMADSGVADPSPDVDAGPDGDDAASDVDATADTEVGPAPDADTDLGEVDASSGTTPILSLQSHPESILCTDASIQTVLSDIVVEGVVTVARYESSPSVWGYIISDAAGAGSSIVLAVTKQSGLDGNWAVGTKLRVTGAYEEFFCNSELITDAVEVLGTAAAPGPFQLTVADFKANSESWEGVLVRVAGPVKVTSINAMGELSTDAGFVIDDDILDAAIAPLPAVNTVYGSVTGVIMWSFGNYRLQIRSMNDLLADL